MPQSTAKTEYISIGEAASRLRVSIDTIRRWEASGKISAIRTPKGVRLFSVSHIEALMPYINPSNADTLSVSQAATYLGVSAATLRRWDRQGILNPKRTLGNERFYEKDALTTFIQTSARKPAPVSPASPGQLIKETAGVLSDVVISPLLDRFNSRFSILATGGLIIGVLLLGILLHQTQSAKMIALPGPRFDTTKATLALAHPDDMPSYGQLKRVAPSQAIPLQAGVAAPLTDTAASPMTITFSPDSDQPMIGTMTISNIPTLSAQSIDPQTGSQVIPAGKQSVFVIMPTITQHTKVFLTATSPNAGLYVSEQIVGQGFVVKTSQPITQPVTFDWLVIN